MNFFSKTNVFKTLMIVASCPLIACGTEQNDPLLAVADDEAIDVGTQEANVVTERTAPMGTVVSTEGENGPLTYVSFNDSTKIIGKNNLTPVKNNGANVDTPFRSTVDAYGVISMGCSATYIGKNMVLTAGHCFGAGEDREDDTSCDGITVEWGVRVDKKSYLTSKCTRVLAMQQSEDFDYAVFTVDKAPRAAVAMDLARRAPTNRKLTIFGHPQLRPLEWSKYCVMKPASAGGWGKGQFSHQCDTEPGSSGSTILDGRNAKIIGIHDGGIAPWNYGTHLLDTAIVDFW
jgi:V8-like Glu-specific endopeptidase